MQVDRNIFYALPFMRLNDNVPKKQQQHPQMHIKYIINNYYECVLNIK